MKPPSMDGGIFITFEGSDGTGKSTQIARLRRHLDKIGDGLRISVLREPGGTILGERIRDLLKAFEPDLSIENAAELLLFAASRAQLVREVILPALSNNEIVICDRFLDSTTVYQGVARRLDSETVSAINNFAAGSRRPDITFLLDLPTEMAVARAMEREDPLHLAPDRMEQESRAFYEAVRQGYLQLAANHQDRFVIVDASQSIDKIESNIWTHLTQRFHGFRSSRRA